MSERRLFNYTDTQLRAMGPPFNASLILPLNLLGYERNKWRISPGDLHFKISTNLNRTLSRCRQTQEFNVQDGEN